MPPSPIRRLIIQRLLIAWPLALLLTTTLILLPTGLEARTATRRLTAREQTYGVVQLCAPCFARAYAGFVQDFWSGHFELGTRSRLTTPTLLQRATPVTGLMILFVVLVALPVGIVLGLIIYQRRRQGREALWLVGTLLGLSLPSFLLLTLAISVLVSLGRRLDVQLIRLVGGFVIDRRLIVPVLILALRPTAYVAQTTSIVAEDIFRQDFIRTARGKGLSEARIWLRHALPHLLLPWLTALWASVRFTFGALLIVEVLLNYHGLGLIIMDNLGVAGAPGLQGGALDYRQTATIAALLATVFLWLDTVFALLARQSDPRGQG
jgi:peptide/nickel transport system permease protein